MILKTFGIIILVGNVLIISEIGVLFSCFKGNEIIFTYLHMRCITCKNFL